MSQRKECDICAGSQLTTCFMRCPYCSFETCKKCTKTFLMSLEDDNPRCMNTTCKKIWTGDFLADNFDNTFHNKTYRTRRAQIQFEREKSLLPETQLLLEQNKKLKAQIVELNDEEETIRARLRIIVAQKEEIRSIINSDRKVATKKQFIKACPIDACRGFLSDEFKCGMCDTAVCKKCHIPLDNNDEKKHECDSNTLETIKLLAKDTKPCPNQSCNTPIFKISGCDQMYCTKCHTAFSWKNGVIEKGVVHNPHFYAWQRENGGGVAPRVEGDNACGGRVTFTNLRNTLDKYKIKNDNINDAHRLLGHIEGVTMRQYDTTINKHQYLRMMYLEKEIDEVKWLSELKRSYKSIEKKIATREILTMFCTTLSDLFNNIYASKNHAEALTYIKAIENLRLYTNDVFGKIGTRFNSVSPVINEDWSRTSLK